MASLTVQSTSCTTGKCGGYSQENESLDNKRKKPEQEDQRKETKEHIQNWNRIQKNIFYVLMNHTVFEKKKVVLDIDELM